MSKTDIHTGRSEKGQSLLEVVTGVFIMVPVVVMSIDTVFLINASHTNQQLAQNAARLAASKSDPTAASTAAQAVVDEYQTSKLIPSVAMTNFSYNPISKVVSVTTNLESVPPIPIPGRQSIALTAQSAQPIVAIPAAR